MNQSRIHISSQNTKLKLLFVLVCPLFFFAITGAWIQQRKIQTAQKIIIQLIKKGLYITSVCGPLSRMPARLHFLENYKLIKVTLPLCIMHNNQLITVSINFTLSNFTFLLDLLMSHVIKSYYFYCHIILIIESFFMIKSS